MTGSPPHPTQTTDAPGAAPEVVVVTVAGHLDDDAGARLAAEVAEAAAAAARVDIDLCDVASFTPGGAAWLVRCRDHGSSLPAGLHYRTGRGPGQEALLAAYADEQA